MNTGCLRRKVRCTWSKLLMKNDIIHSNIIRHDKDNFHCLRSCNSITQVLTGRGMMSQTGTWKINLILNTNAFYHISPARPFFCYRRSIYKYYMHLVSKYCIVFIATFLNIVTLLHRTFLRHIVYLHGNIPQRSTWCDNYSLILIYLDSSLNNLDCCFTIIVQ